MTQEEQARGELRSRQGAGARYDDPSAPAPDLNLARQGTAYFARLLANMSDRQLNGQSRTPGVSRREIVARIGLEARFLAETVAWVRDHPGQALPFDAQPIPDGVDFAATLPSLALRNLFSHSEVHLNVEWRDLSASGWVEMAFDRAGKQIPIRATPRWRARSLWYSAHQLGVGGRFADIPYELQVAEH